MKKIDKKPTVSSEEIRQLVVARLRSFPSGKKLSIGSDGEFSKDELIARVNEGDSIGKKIIEIQLSYLRSFKEDTSSWLEA
ncbi:hypothetical protein HY947_03320 [Candidatus Gottesmanbacteria bacterium]|nr:hypothetical protein [Candidatus Gottesmanbacteria bacterium]